MGEEGELVRVISYSPGRLRLKFPPEREEVPDLSRFLQVPAITEVTYRKLTSSLVILYDETSCDLQELLSLISRNYPSLQIAAIPTDLYEREYPTNLLSSVMYYYSDATNQAVHRRTSGAADLTSLIPVAFFAWAIITVIVRPGWPQWFELYSEGSYLWHFYQNSYRT